MRKRRRTILIFGAGLLVGAALGAAAERAWTGAHDGRLTTAGALRGVLSAIRQSFVDSLSDDELYARAAKGVVGTLGDPYSSVLSAGELRDYRATLSGSALSTGLLLADGLSGLRVGAVLPGSPAARAGLVPQLYLTRVGPQATRALSSDRVMALLAADTAPVELELRRPGDSVPMTVSLRPEPLRVAGVQSPATLAPGIGYVALRLMSDNAGRLLRQAVAGLGGRDLAGLVLDLRGNPGGRFEEGLAVADLFLDPGQLIGTVVRREDDSVVHRASGAQPFPGLALAVLVDRRTGSAAEIAAAALRDNGRARLLGERTLGKFSIQTTIPLGDSIAVRLSTGRWRRPDGTAIEGGVLPDSLLASDALLRELAGQAELAAPVLEATARRLAEPGTPADGIALGPDDVSRLAADLGRAGVRIPHAGLAGAAGSLTAEIRRLVAAMRSDGEAAARWGLLGDPVVAAGLAAIRPRPDSASPPPRPE